MLEHRFYPKNPYPNNPSCIRSDSPKRIELIVPYTCLDAKNEMRQLLLTYTRYSSEDFRAMMSAFVGSPMYETTWLNLQTSMTLVDIFLEKREGFAEIQKGSQPPSGSGRIFQLPNRFFSWNSLVSLAGRETNGAAMAAERSQEFSENLIRTHHVAGFIKINLFAVFPWQVFVLVAGYWRILVYWYSGYLSVLLWTPIWTLFYHIVVGIFLSTEALSALGRMSDGVSLYSAELVTSRMNYMFAVYSWLQLLIGVALSGTILWIVRPMLSDSQSESAAEFLSEAKSNAGTALSAAKGVL